MEKDNNTRPYVKLGSKASGFYAPYSHFKVGVGEIKQLPSTYTKDGVIQSAISGGHLTYASEPEVEAYFKGKGSVSGVEVEGLEEAKEEIMNLNNILSSKQKTLEERSRLLEEKEKSIELLEAGKENIFKYDEDGLVKYITETYELEKEELKKFKKMSFEDKRAYAYDLEKNSVSE